MSERDDYEAGKEARRTVLRDAEQGRTGDHMDAVLRYMKGAGEGASNSGPRVRLTDDEIHTRVVDRVLDAGGEVSAAIVSAGSVWLRGHVGCRSEIGLIERNLREIPGVVRLDLRLGYDIDDTSGASAGAGDDLR